MSCKCKNIIENFQGGTIPLDTTFLGNVDICNTGTTLSVSNIIGCSPITIGSDSGCTSGNTTLIISGSSVFSCDIDVLGGIYSGGTNLIDIFSSGGADLATVLAAGNTTSGNNIIMTEGDDVIFKYAGFNNNINTEPITTNRNINFPDNDGVVALTSDITPYVTGGTYISSASTINFTNTDGGTFSVTGITSGGGSSSGVWGISDNTGTYTYYDTISDANAVAVSGDVIELFSNVNETTATEMYLVNGVTYQLNGHSYTLDVADAVTNTVSTSGLSSSDSVTILNGKIVRTGNTGASDMAGLALYANHGATLYINGVTFSCEDSTTVYVNNGSSIYGGTFINTAASYNFNKLALRMVTGTVNGCNFYSTNSYSVRKTSGNLENCNIYSKSSRALYDTSSVTNITANCNIRSDGDYAYYQGSSNTRIHNCFCYSTVNAAIYLIGHAYNCVGFSTGNYGVRLSSSQAYGNNCSFISDTSVGVYANNALSTIYNCTAYARVNNAYYGKGNAFNCSFRNDFNFSGGHCVNLIVDGTYTSQFFNCVIRPYSSAAYCITASSALNLYYGANVFENATTPINTGVITQAQTNTTDTFGNIQVG